MPNFGIPNIQPPSIAPLPRWNQALSLRSVAPAKVVFIGDSITEGQGASLMANRWVDLFAANIRHVYSTNGTRSGGENYLPSFNLVQSPDSPWTAPAVTGTVTQYQTMGLGLHSSLMTSAASITWTVWGDSTTLRYYTFPAAGTFSYSIDGAAATNINAVSGSDLPSGGATHLSLGSMGIHTVKITWVSGNIIFHGLDIYAGDYTSGVQVFNAGRYGALSGNFTSTADTGTANGTTVASAHNQAVSAIAPHLVVIELGANDWLNDTGAYGPTYTQANLQQLINQCRAYTSPPDILLLSTYQLPQSQSTSTHVWSEYCTVMDTLAANNSNVYRLDLRTKFDSPISVSLLRTSDARHPNDMGHAAISNQVSNVLSPLGESQDYNVFLSPLNVSTTGVSIVNNIELCTLSSNITRTLPSSPAIGDQLTYINQGAYGVTTSTLSITPPSGVTVAGTTSPFTTSIGGSSITLQYVAANTWVILSISSGPAQLGYFDGGTSI